MQRFTTEQRLELAQVQWQKIFNSKAQHEDAGGVNRPTKFSSHNSAEAIENKLWGDKIKEKADGHLRIYAGNVNGFALDRLGGHFDIFCKTLKEVQADVVCGQEPNIDTTKSQVQSILFNKAQQHWRRNRVDFTTSPHQFYTMYKPGGTFLMSMGNVTGRVKDRHHDKWGQWASQTLQGREGQSLVVISAYQVSTDYPNPGTITAASQQKSLLIQDGDPLILPRQAFRRDLKRHLQECQHSGHEIILCGNFNDDMSMREKEGVARMLEDVGLVNLMSHRHNNLPQAIYIRGNKCLDQVFGTRQVAEALVHAGYEAFQERYHTDHCMYFVDLSMDKLFGLDHQPLSTYKPRQVKSNNPQQVTKYIEKKYELLAHHNAFQQARQLLSHEYAERLDSDVLAASLASEKAIARIAGEPQWSVTLSKSRKRVQVLPKLISMMKTGVDMHQIVKNEWEALAINEDLPTTRLETSTRLRAAKNEVKEVVRNSFERRDTERKRKIEALQMLSKQNDKKTGQNLALYPKRRSNQKVIRKT
jgi:hypothetical protein